MGHPAGLGLNVINEGPATANGAIFESLAQPRGHFERCLTLAVANYDNDSISVFTGGLGNWSSVPSEIDLRPGDGTSTTMVHRAANTHFGW